MFGINQDIACYTVRKDPIQKSLYSKKRKLPSFRGIGSIGVEKLDNPGNYLAAGLSKLWNQTDTPYHGSIALRIDWAI